MEPGLPFHTLRWGGENEGDFTKFDVFDARNNQRGLSGGPHYLFQKASGFFGGSHSVLILTDLRDGASSRFVSKPST